MRWRTVVVGLLLLVMLAAAVVLTLESRRSARAARETAERVLRDYASFAAAQYARIAARSLEQAFNHAVSNHLDPDCNCETVATRAVARFQFDPVAQTWISPPPERADLRALIADHVRAPAGAGEQRDGLRFRVLPARGGAVAWHHDSRPGQGPLAHGIVTDTAFIEAALRKAASESLLPPALVGGGRADGLIAVKAHAPDGQEVFSSHNASWNPSTASEPVPIGGGMSASVSLAPAGASTLIIGGLPRTRLALVYGLLGLASALVLMAAYQLSREAELARLRADFVSGVSHELRTPLAQIRMFAETLRLGRVRSPEESTRALDVILQESQRLSALAENVLLFARGERASHVVEPELTSLTDLVTAIADDLRPMAQARRAAIETIVEPDLRARVDAGALRQVLLNLVDNALKYGTPGQTVTVGLRHEGDGARIWVEDQGPGVPPEDARRIWEPFWRRGTAGQGGSGIGLSIVRDLVRLHGGRVFVDPAYTSGARFVVVLPA